MAGDILGISAFYHDSAACLVRQGRVVAAAQEERFTRKKHDPGFPSRAVEHVLEAGGVDLDGLEAVAFYDKPYLKFERLLETYHAFAPKGLMSFLAAMPVWIREKLFLKKLIRDELARFGGQVPRLLFPEHHLSHAASAFYPSPFESAAILTMDGVGEWASTTIGHGRGKDMEMLREQRFPHSLGLLYSAFTAYLGFKVNSGEYKLMGLAPYGADKRRVGRYEALIRDNLVDLRPDGSMLLNMSYFDFATGLRMCAERKWAKLFGFKKRESESELGQEHMDLALAIQRVTEDAVLRLARTARELTGEDNLALAGGVALNCVANGKLAKSGIFKNIWVQPASGDAGGALGAALAAWHIHGGREREVAADRHDAMEGSYLGPEFDSREIEETLAGLGAEFTRIEDQGELCREVAGLLDAGKVVGWFQGRMEYGPRALGNRSILGDPRNPDMQKKLNLKIKYREGFRPFAPSVLAECAKEYFDLETPSPYMLFVAEVSERKKYAVPAGYDKMSMYERLYKPRSVIPAVTHVDFSARIQTVHEETNPLYWSLIDAFRRLTGCPLVVNTSFNVRGEPIVATPRDAYVCFMRTGMDHLVLGDLVLDKERQPEWSEDGDWRDRFELD